MGQAEPTMNTRVVQAFNTVNVLGIYGSDAVLDEAEQLCRRFEALFSHTLPESSLVRVNRAGGASVEVEEELAGLVASALGYCEASGGLFDITVGPLVALWDFHTGRVPEPEALERACELVDYRQVHVEGSRIRLANPEGSIALGGIAKGYIADALVSFFKERGVERGLVNLGGNACVFGGKPDGSPWSVGLRVPRPSQDAEEQAFAALPLADGSVVTSGIYERCFTGEDGQFYHHILDPRTGMPAQTDLAAVSLVSERSLDGDGYTTALVAMGLEAALRFVEELPACEAVFITRDNEVYGSSGIGSKIELRLLDRE